MEQELKEYEASSARGSMAPNARESTAPNARESTAFEPEESLERTPVNLTWFYFFSLASMGLCLAMLFSVQLLRYDPGYDSDYDLGYGSFDGLLYEDGVHIPDYYLVGISGACSIVLGYDGDQRHCRWGFPQSPGILSLIAPDLNGTNTTNWQSWSTALLETGNIMATQSVLWTQLSQAAAALLVLSIFLTIFTVAYTHFEDRAYPTRTIVLDILDAAIVLAASAMWTSIIVSAGTNTVSDTAQDMSIGPGLWILWSVFLGKLLITPKMVYYLFVRPFTFCLVHCLRNMNAAARREANNIDQTETMILSRL